MDMDEFEPPKHQHQPVSGSCVAGCGLWVVGCGMWDVGSLARLGDGRRGPLGYGAGGDSGLERAAAAGADPVGSSNAATQQTQHQPEDQTADRRPQSLELELEHGPSLATVGSPTVLSESRCWLGSWGWCSRSVDAGQVANTVEYRAGVKVVRRGEIEWMQQRECCSSADAAMLRSDSICCPATAGARDNRGRRYEAPGEDIIAELSSAVRSTARAPGGTGFCQPAPPPAHSSWLPPSPAPPPAARKHTGRNVETPPANGTAAPGPSL
ncbi:hypothetical protein N431DRAFT_452250 [Stipitochalara longipes BDJ]|nr:hypothetical protein N431DRAFT_452250 [Stipitochalara longipes BDJ]